MMIDFMIMIIDMMMYDDNDDRSRKDDRFKKSVSYKYRL